MVPDPYFAGGDSFWISCSNELSYIFSSESFFTSTALSARPQIDALWLSDALAELERLVEEHRSAPTR